MESQQQSDIQPEINSAAVQLCRIISDLLKDEAPYSERQEQLARDLGVDSPTISKIKFYKPEWEAHFRLFMKLVPIAIRYGIMGADDLLPPEDNHEPSRSMGSRSSPKAKARR